MLITLTHIDPEELCVWCLCTMLLNPTAQDHTIIHSIVQLNAEAERERAKERDKDAKVNPQI